MRAITGFLRQAKWLLYCVELVALSLVGSVAGAIPRKRMSVVLTGEMNYTGGTFSYFVNLIDLFLDEGFIVSVILARRYYGSQLGSLAKRKGVRVFVIPDTFVFVEHLVSLWRTICLRPECLIVSASGPGTYTMSMLWKIPSIHIFHSVVGDSFGKRWLRVLQWFFRKPHRLVATSRCALEAYVKYFRLPPRLHGLVSLVYNGVPDCWKEPDRMHLEEEIVLTIGHVVDYKNPSIWLQTAQYVTGRFPKRITFLWTGEGPELEHYRKVTEDLPQIRFLGFTEDLSTLLRNATIYYLPSKMENCNLSVQQAMSMGLPCVVSDRGGLPELVVDRQNGFVCSCDDFKSQGDAILRLLENEKLRKAMSQEARKLYAERFSMKRWGGEILNVAIPRPGIARTPGLD
jgi:glycosyltransferase involved in cell wall biosynthesis